MMGCVCDRFGSLDAIVVRIPFLVLLFLMLVLMMYTPFLADVGGGSGTYTPTL